MKATVLLLVFLAVTGIVNARHRQDSRQESRREHRRENRLSERDKQHKWKHSSEENRLDDRNAKWQDKPKDDRQDYSRDNNENSRDSNRQKNLQDSRQNHKQESSEENRQSSGEEQRQQIRLQWKSESESDRPSGRDIIIENRGKIVNNGMERKAQTTQKQLLLNQLGYTQNIGADTTNKETLLKQKFLLDIVLNVKQPLKNERLEALGQTLILDEQQYTEQLDDDMLLLVQLCVDGQMLSQQDNFNALNLQHMRQLLGLYKLLLRARDWDTVQRNACFLRLHLNGELFINALLLAVRERNDTQELILPAINEILPELYYDSGLLQKARDIDMGVLAEVKTSSKPQPQNMWKHENVRAFSGGMRSTPQGAARWGARAGAPQTEKTWQEWRQEKLNKQAGGANAPIAGLSVQPNIIIPVPLVENERLNNLEQRIAYLTQDVGLNNFWYNFGIDSISKVKIATRENRVDAPKNFEKKQDLKSQTKLDTRTSKRLLYSNRRRWQQEQEDMVQNKENIESNENDLQILKDRRQDGPRTGYLDNKLIDERILQLKQQLQRESQIQNSRDTLNWEGQNIAGSNMDRLLKINRRRLNQNIQSNDNSNEILVENNDDSRRVLNLENFNEEINIHKGLGRTTDDARLLKVNRRRLNTRKSAEKLSSEESKEITSRDSRESIENKRQAQNLGEKFNNIRDSQIDEARLLKVNRRRMYRNQFGNTQDSDEGIVSVFNERLPANQKIRQDSRQAVSPQDSSEEINQNSSQNIGIFTSKRNDDERLLKVNRRRIQQKADAHDLTGKNIQAVREEIQQAAYTRVEQDSGEQKGINNINSQDSNEQIGVTDRSQEDDLHMQQLQSQKVEAVESIGMLRSSRIENPRLLKVNRRRNRKTSKESSSQEDAKELQLENHDTHSKNSKESSSQESSYEILMEKSQKRSSEESSEEREQLKIGRRRMPRSIRPQLQIADMRAGELTLTNMQQIQARLQMERLSHQLEVVLGKQTKQKTISRKQQSPTLESENSPLFSQVQGVARVLRTIVEDELQLLSPDGHINLQQLNVLEVIGEVITNRLSNTGLDVFQVWSQLEQQLRHLQLQQTKTGSLISLSNMAQQLREPLISFLMQRILGIANIYIEQLPSYAAEDLLLNGVEINDIKVDKLQTYFDAIDADLINALDESQVKDLSKLQHTIVARQQRLNHKSFSLRFEVNAARAERVIIRTFLGPKLDANGNAMQLNENRHNFMLLDAFPTALTVGHNSIERKSADISWTSRDATPLTQIYKQVVLGLERSQDVQLSAMSGNSCRFPQRLLLPRGLPQGLPMQLFVIITPVTEQDAWLQQQQQQQIDGNICGMGIAAIALDTLPLGFPLDRRIDNVQNMLVPNIMLKDITIFHDGATDIAQNGS